MMKYTLLITLFFLASSARADRLDSNGIIRNDDGFARRLTHEQASTACPEGFHLPTIRELANASAALGSQGILEVKDVGEGQDPPDDYWPLIKGTNPDGNIDQFYFSFEGYQPPEGDLGTENFWSSTVRTFPGYTLAYSLEGKLGSLESGVREGKYANHFAVRCFKN